MPRIRTAGRPDRAQAQALRESVERYRGGGYVDGESRPADQAPPRDGTMREADRRSPEGHGAP